MLARRPMRAVHTGASIPRSCSALSADALCAGFIGIKVIAINSREFAKLLLEIPRAVRVMRNQLPAHILLGLLEFRTMLVGREGRSLPTLQSAVVAQRFYVRLGLTVHKPLVRHANMRRSLLCANRPRVLFSWASDSALKSFVEFRSRVERVRVSNPMAIQIYFPTVCHLLRSPT